jgi:hypothetical protein
MEKKKGKKKEKKEGMKLLTQTGTLRLFTLTFGFAFTCTFIAASYSSLNQSFVKIKCCKILLTDTQFH